MDKARVKQFERLWKSYHRGESDVDGDQIVLSEAIFSHVEDPAPLWTAWGVCYLRADDREGIERVAGAFLEQRILKIEQTFSVMLDSRIVYLMEADGTPDARGRRVLADTYDPYEPWFTPRLIDVCDYRDDGRDHRNESPVRIDLAALGLC